MSIFDEVGLTWKGTEYTVPSDRVMGLIEVIEEEVTLEELTRKTGLMRGKISKAYTNALKYAGCREVTQEQVYSMFFNPETAIEMQSIISSLLMMMIPPEHLQEPAPKPKTPAKKKRSAKGS